jgi:hypothetical protein
MKIPILQILCAVLATLVMDATAGAQGIEPYPNAVTDRAIHPETPMLPPPRNVVVTDPDFGSSIVRATDETTNFKLPGTALSSEGSGEANAWSADTKKFYALGRGGQVLALAFDPSTMAVSSLPNARSGQALLLPLGPGPSFSFVDPDLIYGTSKDPLTITSYRFSTAVLNPVIDTRTCGVQPPLGSGPLVRSDDDVSLSLDDSRVSISEGGAEGGRHMFVVVYDRNLGCRWYNTQTGQIGGQWGSSGTATVATSYLIRHAYLARSGDYVHILTNAGVSYFWDLSTLNVTSCALGTHEQCSGYGVMGYNAYVNGPGLLGNMDIVKRPVSDLSDITPLVYPPLSPINWGQPEHFTWSNVDVNDSAPVCGSTYGYDGDLTIDQPFAAEIWCVETDGLASTVWRFAHNRAIWIEPYFNTQPLGDVSPDGRFFLFSSDWDAQLGNGTDGRPRSDVFIVKLD